MLSTKLCECGCGKPTPLYTRTRPELGYTKGKPRRFIFGHNGCFRKRSTHCPAGHKLSGSNLVFCRARVSLSTGKPYREASHCRICVDRRAKHRRSTPEGKTERTLEHLKYRGVSKKELLRAAPIILKFFKRPKSKRTCPICGDNCSGKKQFAADHNHETMRFRDMICSPCNIALGVVREREDLLGNGKLGRYLKEHKELTC